MRQEMKYENRWILTASVDEIVDKAFTCNWTIESLMYWLKVKNAQNLEKIAKGD